MEDIFARARVVDVVAQGEREGFAIPDQYQTLLLTVLDGPDAGEVVTIEYEAPAPLFAAQHFTQGDVAIVTMSPGVGDGHYEIVDQLRLPAAGLLLIIFFALAVILGRGRGAAALLGLLVSIVVLVLGVVPAITHGVPAAIACGGGAAIIAVCSMLFAHGWSRATAVALGATLVTLLCAFLIAAGAVELVGLSGMGTEEAMFLQFSALPGIDLRGLLWGGMVIGALGVLDDVTTAQVAAVREISEAADSRLSWRQLALRGTRVGREHIAALVNTLALAYVGAALPLVLLFLLPGSAPWWVVANSERVMEEVARIIVGATALLLAVPISTLASAWLWGKRS